MGSSRDGTGPARRDMVEGRAKQAFKTWLANRADNEENKPSREHASVPAGQRVQTQSLRWISWTILANSPGLTPSTVDGGSALAPEQALHQSLPCR
jgi:hypothetical protein